MGTFKWTDGEMDNSCVAAMPSGVVSVQDDPMTAANKWAHLNDLTDILYSSQCNSFNCSSLDAINTRASNT